MPSSTLLASLGHPGLSPAPTPSPLATRNHLDDKEKQRLLRQARKLSQILGELPQATVAPPHLVRGSTPTEVPPTGLSQLHVPSSVRSFTEPSSRSSSRLSFMFHTVAASMVSPSLLPSDHDDSIRTEPNRRSSIIPAHINQLGLTRFGLGRRHDHRPLVAETLSDSSDLHSPDHIHVTRPRNKPRWRSVYNPSPVECNARPRRSEDSSMPACPPRRSASLSETHPPLSESQRILSLRRGRKLEQVFGTVPPIALYRAPSRLEDVPATLDAVQRERTKTYLVLSSGDLRSGNSESASRHQSQSSLPSAVSISPPSPSPTVADVEAPRETESDQTSPHPLSDPDEDPDSTMHSPRDRSEDSIAFRRRRLRAAKLSRFFGVTYNDLSGPIGMAVQGRQDDGEGASPQGTEVDVRIDGPGWFWNRADSNHGGGEGAQDADMNDVIALLRQMPRA